MGVSIEDKVYLFLLSVKSLIRLASSRKHFFYYTVNVSRFRLGNFYKRSAGIIKTVQNGPIATSIILIPDN